MNAEASDVAAQIAAIDKPKSTSLTELRREVATPIERMPVVRAGYTDLQSFELLQRAAKALSQSTLIPKRFQGSLANCMIVLEMAQRLGASPLLCAQNLYIVHDSPSWSAKFLIATFNQCGRFTAIRYEWGGTEGKDDWSCRAWATEKSSGERIQGPVMSIALSKKEGWFQKQGSKWQTIPQLMLMYRSAAWLVNTHAPELSMGLNTAEEMGDVFDATNDNGQFRVNAEDLRRAEQPPPDVLPETAAPEPSGE